MIQFKKIISLLLTVSFLCSSSASVFASTNNISTEKEKKNITENEGSCSFGNTRIDYYETETGDRIFLEYVNGILTQKNTLPYGQDDIVIREYFKSTEIQNNRCRTTDIIHPSDYINKAENCESNEASIMPLAKTSTETKKGRINYRAAIDTGLINYSMKCSYTKSTGTGTYTINKYKGKIVDLVTILVSVTELAAPAGTSYITRLLIAAGISVTGGAIKKPLTTTVACKIITFKWKLIDTKDSAHKTTYKGYKYVVTDTRYHTNEKYFEGLVAKDWKTQTLAVLFHDKLFGYTSYSVTGWTKY